MKALAAALIALLIGVQAAEASTIFKFYDTPVKMTDKLVQHEIHVLRQWYVCKENLVLTPLRSLKKKNGGAVLTCGTPTKEELALYQDVFLGLLKVQSTLGAKGPLDQAENMEPLPKPPPRPTLPTP